MKTGRYSLKQLLNSDDIEQIIIPEIQRDYVWQQRHVEGLLNSIFSHYKDKTNLRLDIRCEQEAIPGDAQKFLTEEYLRLRFNTRIGFIYAYHDPTYAGKFFLIDGQQRLTTLFLLLQVLYCYGTDKSTKDLYAKIYFKHELPRLDYKVREVTHDFLVAFIKHGLSEDTESFVNSKDYYDIYDTDATARTMLDNYHFIIRFLSEKNYLPNSLPERQRLIDYMENYIEFNYFDTNRSEQGERLYLYMNSRGEELSEQENVKSILIGRSNRKLLDSECWEDWQNFFWRTRGNNPNADPGFQSFLKMATVIHLCTTADPQLKTGKENQSKRQIKEDYIKLCEGDELTVQQYHIRNYQKENTSFDIDWLKQIFDSLEKLHHYDGTADGYIRESWLNHIQFTIDYVTILGCIYYLYLFPDAGRSDVKRIGMHLKNICFYDANRKNPNSTVIIVLESLKKMKEQGIRDIADRKIPQLELDERMFSRSDKVKNDLYQSEEREQWEKVFWQIVNDNNLNSFLQGNPSVLTNLCSLQPTELLSPERVEEYYFLFKEKIYNHKNSTELRYQLLKFGDYSLNDGGYGYLYGNMERWNFIEDDNDWYRLLTGEREGGPGIIRSYMDGLQPPASAKRDWKACLADPKYGCMDYMEQNKFLWLNRLDDGSAPVRPHVVLLRKHQASESNSQELAIRILHKLIPDSWVWNYRTCVIEFDVVNGRCKIGKKNEKNYYLDIIYEWKDRAGSWSYKLGHRQHAIDKGLLNDLKNATNYPWEIDKDGKFCTQVFVDKESDTDESAARHLEEATGKLLDRINKVLPGNATTEQ